MAPADRARAAIETSVLETRIVQLDGGTAEGNALYARCAGCVDTVDTDGCPITEYWGTTLAGDHWRVHLHRVVTP